MRSAVECGGKRQRDTAFVLTGDARKRPRPILPQNLSKAAWRGRFPPHSKALRASHSPKNS